jgi:hypothetical protein
MEMTSSDNMGKCLGTPKNRNINIFSISIEERRSLWLGSIQEAEIGSTKTRETALEVR